MIELIVLDLCAVLLAPEPLVKLYISQAEKDGLRIYCFADLPRKHLRHALLSRSLMDDFDGLLYNEVLSQMSASEFRVLADTARTLWVRHPGDINYNNVLPLLPPRQRALPRALRLSPLADKATFETEPQ